MSPARRASFIFFLPVGLMRSPITVPGRTFTACMAEQTQLSGW